MEEMREIKMLKEIAGDYFRTFTIGGIIELLKTNATAFVSMIYPLFVWFLMLGSGREDGIVFLMIYLPVLFIFFSFSMHPVRLHKMMYLCPMRADRRRAYIRYSYFFRIAVQMAAAFAGTVLLMVYAQCSIISAAEILLSDFILSILIPLKKKTDECYGNFDRETVYLSCMITISVLSAFGQMVIVSDKEPHVILQIIIMVCFVMIQLPLTLRYWKYVKRELEAAVYYEETEAI